MIKRPIMVVVSMFILITTLACNLSIGNFGRRVMRGSGRVTEENRDIGAIDGVELATIGTLTIEVGEEEALRVEAEDNLLPYIHTEVRGGTLVIDTEPQTNLRNTKPIAYYLTVQELETLALTSSGDVDAPDLEADRFSIRVSSSGDLMMGELTCESCDIRLSSSGDARLEAVYAPRLDIRVSSSGNLAINGGDVERQDVILSSSGNYDARDLDCETASITINSSGSATVWVDERLNADLSSSGNLIYYGDPTIEANTSSSGDVVNAGD